MRLDSGLSDPLLERIPSIDLQMNSSWSSDRDRHRLPFYTRASALALNDMWVPGEVDLGCLRPRSVGVTGAGFCVRRGVPPPVNLDGR